MTFEEMGLRDELLRAIQESGYTQPTPIQARAIPELLTGRDLICCAQTGTGKTAAFGLPILHQLAMGERADIRALVLVPTRELAMQVAEALREYGKHLELVTATVFGGVPIEPQEKALRRGVDILVATPGRLKDHVWRGNIDFRNTRYLVLDEADRMLDMGFIKAVREIVELLPEERQSLLFSATLDEEIRRLSQHILRDPLRIEVAPPASTLDAVDQFLVETSRGQKRSMLESLIRRQGMTRTLIFARTKSGASRLASQLRERGHKASAIHSDRSQSDRIRTLEGFREGRIDFLVATDIAARGIDVDDISHVVNYDLPFSTKDYVHRIGRTARAGRRGVAISLVTPEDARGIAAIERLISKKLTWMGERAPERPRERTHEPTEARRPAREQRPRPERRVARPMPPREDDSRSKARPESRRHHTGAAHRQPAAVAGEVSSARQRVVRAHPAHERFDRKSPAREAAGVVQSVVERLRHGLFAAKR